MSKIDLYKDAFYSYSKNTVKNIMEKYGKYSIKTKEYQRFKADKTENRSHKADKTLEYLHILKKRMWVINKTL